MSAFREGMRQALTELVQGRASVARQTEVVCDEYKECGGLKRVRTSGTLRPPTGSSYRGPVAALRDLRKRGFPAKFALTVFSLLPESKWAWAPRLLGYKDPAFHAFCNLDFMETAGMADDCAKESSSGEGGIGVVLVTLPEVGWGGPYAHLLGRPLLGPRM